VHRDSADAHAHADEDEHDREHEHEVARGHLARGARTPGITAQTLAQILTAGDTLRGVSARSGINSAELSDWA
jgi:hypothetical protein